jgi:hypothetical protein
MKGKGTIGPKMPTIGRIKGQKAEDVANLEGGGMNEN